MSADSPDHELLMIDVAGRLKQLRYERGQSMRQLARLSGLSTNALSMIERGRVSPSVSTLYKLADALGVPITAFFRLEPEQKEVVFRLAAQRKKVIFPQGVWEGLGGEAFKGRVEPFVIKLEPGADSGPYGMLHSGSEFVMGLAGEIEYQVEDQIYCLHEGDTLIFAAQLRHRWRNPGPVQAAALIVLAGFEQGERPSEFHVTASAQPGTAARGK